MTFTGFFKVGTTESMTRLIAFIFALGAVGVAIVGTITKFEYTWQTVTALSLNGSVAIMKRSHSKDVTDAT